MTPFLKWPGGKRWLVTTNPDVFPSRYDRYIEPFLGAGSVYFHLQPQSAILSDVNSELIATYCVVRDDWQSLVQQLSRHQTRHATEYYYSVRESTPRLPVTSAARMIYLNRTCFNGIYRVNRMGEFNVPIGTKSNVLMETDDFPSISRLLKNADIRVADFEEVIDEAGEGDLVFADPPYTVRHNLNGFIKYNERLFSWDDQIRLAAALERANLRGAYVVSTNANHDSLRQLYCRRGFRLLTISRFSSISAEGKTRGKFEELLIRSK